VWIPCCAIGSSGGLSQSFKTVPKSKVCVFIYTIYGGSAPHESWHKLKLTGRAINTVGLAVPEYLHWSESLISFDWTDHPSSIPKPGRFPLKVNPLVCMTRLSKALMDGSSGLNLMYLNTFELIGLARDQL
jgi:hypothetical protein